MNDRSEKNHAEQNARAWSESIAEMVAALECDYDRLSELRDEREALADEVSNASEAFKATEPEAYNAATMALAEWDAENAEELIELKDSATVDGAEMKDADEARERIEESPLSVQVRSGWNTPGETMHAEEFEILLSTGGPALRIRGELDENLQPYRAWMEYQDWGTTWMQYIGDSDRTWSERKRDAETLLAFASVFYFGA